MHFTDFKKSVFSVFEDRISSPFYGSFVLSWSLWNWKIIYLTIFISQEAIKPSTKIDYILENYSRWDHLLIYPFFSSLLLVLAIPWLANQLYKVSLYYDKERRVAKEKNESNKRLSIEESWQIRNELFTQVENHQRQLTAKDGEIKFFKQQIENLTGDKTSFEDQIKILTDEKEKFKIVYACYGKDPKIKDVTKQVTALLQQNKEFIINNTHFEGDPTPGKYKDFLVVYTGNGQTHVLRSKEHFIVTKKDNILVVSNTKNSDKLKEKIDGIRFQKLFPGRWRNTYSGEISGAEEFEMRNGTQYFVRVLPGDEFQHLLNIEEIYLNQDEGIIEFTKVGIMPDERRVKNEVRIIEKLALYEGIENSGNITVTYEKL
jgi:hypothetical protein